MRASERVMLRKLPSRSGSSRFLDVEIVVANGLIELPLIADLGLSIVSRAIGDDGVPFVMGVDLSGAKLDPIALVCVNMRCSKRTQVTRVRQKAK